MTALERDETGTCTRYGSTFSSIPAASRSATIFLRASKRSSPAYGPAVSESVPSFSMIETTGRPWRCPISKSFLSWPGVILSAPEPKSCFT